MSRIAKSSLVGLLCLGAIATMVSSIGDSPDLEPVLDPDDYSMTPGGQAYVAFMVPRRDRLIDESSAVSSLVAERGRNRIGLRGRGSRINALTSEIMDWNSSNSVPDRFRGTHGLLVGAADELSGSINEAQSAFLRLDFEGMGDLATRFERASATVRTVRDPLPVPVHEPS